MASSSLYKAGFEAFKNDAKARIRNTKDQQLLDAFLARTGSPHDALNSAKALKKDADKKYGDHDMMNGKVIIEKKWISNVLDNISNFIEIGDFVMKKAPENVATAWFAVSLALDAIQSNYALYSMFGSGLSDMTEMMVTITHYERIYDERGTPGFKDSDILRKLFQDIINTYAAMLDYSFSIQRHLSGDGWAKLRHGIKDFFNAEVLKFKVKSDKIAETKRKVIEDSDAAFQSKAFQQLGSVQDAIKENLDGVKAFQKSSEEFYHAQLEMMEGLENTLNKIKPLTRHQTRWDVAMQSFQDIGDMLEPLRNTRDPLNNALGKKLDDTCAWLPEHDLYKAWLEPGRSRMLCITGREGVGKTIALASAFATLESQMDDGTCAMLYLSCGMTRGEIGDKSAGSLNRIRNTLIYEVLQLATSDSSNPALLENCNKIFDDKKSKKKSNNVKESNRNDSIPDLADALSLLSSELEKHIFIILDEVDNMDSDDQDKLFDQLQEFLGRQVNDIRGSGEVNFLLGCCSDNKSNFYQRIKEDAIAAPSISIEDFNRNDIEKRLDIQLEAMSWSESEKTEAREAILNKAGPIFKYVVQVAIPFIQQPYQGPLAERLKDLPDGMEETYLQFIHAMPSNYLDLLRTALSWTLFSARPIKVVEIIEAYRSAYLKPPNGIETCNVTENDKWLRDASELEVQQLRQVAGPFLNLWKDDYINDFVVDLKDHTQVRRFCFAEAEVNKLERSQSQDLCSNCRAHLPPHRAFSFSDKEGHLKLALACVRHLRSPLLWNRYYGWQKNEHDEEKASSTKDDATEHLEAQQQDTGNSDEKETTANQPSSESSEEQQQEAGGEKVSAAEDNGASDSGYDSNDSMLDDDIGDFKRNSTPAKEGASKDDGDDVWRQENATIFRYEMAYWHHHIRMAEALWPREERLNHPLWTNLMQELDGLAFDCPTEFARCQRITLLQEDIDNFDRLLWTRKPWRPLNLACVLRLTSWAEHLIDRGESLTEICAWRTPLQAAARAQPDIDMLKLLLEKNANPNDGTNHRMPSVYSWLWNPNATAEHINLFLQHGARLDLVDTYNHWHAMHYFAAEGTSIEVANLLLNNDDPSNRPDINTKCPTDGNTPLHVLLRRRNVPLKLLQIFVDNGADVNAEDENSERPLQTASFWGDEEVIKIILPEVKATGDIDDPDGHGRTALHEAASQGHSKIVKMLLDNDANVNVLDDHDRNPLFHACQTERGMETAILLLEAMIEKSLPVREINKPTKRGRTPLRQAAARGNNDAICKLLELITNDAEADSGGIINHADKRRGRTALHCASIAGQVESVHLLLEYGADVSVRDKTGKTALELACAQWELSAGDVFEQIIWLLIDKDPPAATRDTELLSAAAVNGSKLILEKLHLHQANLNRPDRYGWTPILLARHNGHSEAEKFIAQIETQTSTWDNAVPYIKLSNEGLTITYKPPQGAQDVCISTKRPLPAGHRTLYFEVTSKKMSEVEQVQFPRVAIGFCTLGASAIKFPGWPATERAPQARSWGYHGDDGAFAASGGKTMIFLKDVDRRYGPGDTIGCGIDFESSSMWYTKNGAKLEPSEVFTNVRGRLFPVIGFIDPVELETNFGSKPFVWKGEEGEAEANDAVENASMQEGGKQAILGADGEAEGDGLAGE